MAGGQALPLARGQSNFLVDPEQVYLETRPGCKYYEPSVHDVPTEREIAWAVKHWITLPITLVQDDDKLICTSGRRRVKIGLAANKIRAERGIKPGQLKAVRAPTNDPLGWSIVENNHRRKAEDPITQAYKAQAYMETGYSEEDAMVAFDFDSVKVVRARVALLQLCQPVQDAVRAGQVPVSKAQGWTKLSVADQRVKLDEFLAPKPKKAKQSRLTPKRAASILERLPSSAPDGVRALLAWLAGTASEEDVAQADKRLAQALHEENGTA